MSPPRAALVEQIVRLVREGANVNVCAPPCMGEDALARDLALEIKAAIPSLRVVRLSPDDVRNVGEFARQLAKGWDLSLPAGTPDPLGWVLDQVHGGVLQILPRFHTILNVVNDVAVLALMRRAEQDHRVQTITLSPLPYPDLKRRWRRSGHAFSTSDYGDTHDPVSVLPLDMDEARARAGAELPAAVLEYLMELSGGFVEVFDVLKRRWSTLAKPDLSPSSRRELEAVAATLSCVQRLLEWLDDDDDARFRRALVDLWQGVDVDDAVDCLRAHPWQRKSELLVADDREVRSLAVGLAAFDLALTRQDAGFEMTSRLERAQVTYLADNYEGTKRLLDTDGVTGDRADLLRAHARIMSTLAGDDERDLPEWKRCRKTISDARSTVQQSGWLDPSGRRLLLDRYASLERVCHRVAKILEADAQRPVDAAVGLGGRGAEIADPLVALQLIEMRLRGARKLRANTLAVHAALPLPEQIFRMWAFYALEIDYYRAPSIEDDVWSQVEALAQTPLGRPASGQTFKSFSSFLRYCFVIQQKRPDVVPLVDKPVELDRLCSLMDARNDKAHAVSTTAPTFRRDLFERIDQWLDAVGRLIGDGGNARDTVSRDLERLPVPDASGGLVW